MTTLLCHPRASGGLYKSIQFLDSRFRGNDKRKDAGMTTPFLSPSRKRGSIRILDSRFRGNDKRESESGGLYEYWIPAFAGMTKERDERMTEKTQAMIILSCCPRVFPLRHPRESGGLYIPCHPRISFPVTLADAGVYINFLDSRFRGNNALLFVTPAKAGVYTSLVTLANAGVYTSLVTLAFLSPSPSRMRGSIQILDSRFRGNDALLFVTLAKSRVHTNTGFPLSRE